MSNFTFLESIDKNLYKIILDAEKLYRDEYFEQCITQTRRFGENICKDVLGDLKTCETTFDDMLATLKEKATKSIQEKEFVDDLYFLKREGNKSVHSSTVKNDGMVALECLQRAFEIALNYAVYYKKANSKLLKSNYNIDLLVTGEKSKKTLGIKYKKNLAQTKTKNNTPKKKDSKCIKNTPKKKPIFLFFWILSVLLSLVILLTFFLITLIS